MRPILQFTLALAASLIALPQVTFAEAQHAISMHGEPQLKPGFAHFPYVNPDAPKAGRINYALQGTFNSLNPFIVQGDAASGLFDSTYGYNVFESLMARSRDEAFTLYPLIAEKVETDAERTFVEFTLDPRARFSDGEPITQDDVIFSMELLREKARPLYRRWIGLVDRIEKVGEQGVRFTFGSEADRELPLLLALLPILPKHAIDAETFDKSSLEPMTASGPYRIDRVEPGELVVLKRNPDYWARDLPSKRGFDNYDEIRITYFRDENTMFEAFKKGLVDIYLDNDPGRWSNGYDFPAVANGKIIKGAFKTGLPSGMYGFVFNSRRAVFQDRAVRDALSKLFDFEWANKNLFFDVYTRTRSFFDGSELAASGNPADDMERKLLAEFPASVRPDVLAGEYAPPVSDGSGRDRKFLKEGFNALRKAGFKLKDRRLIGPDGKQLSFELLLRGKSGQQLAVAWQRTLEKIGIELTIRSVDSAQYLQRQQTYDYDMILMRYFSSLSPGAEQIGRWGSQSRDADGTYNFAGVADPAVDTMIAHLMNARDRGAFVSAVRAYDRVLLSGAWVVPLYHRNEKWVARRKFIEHPEKTPLYGPQFQTWWSTEK